MNEQQKQEHEFPVQDFIQETHITVGELMMQNRMANRVIAKLQEENQALKQNMEEKEITDLNPDETEIPKLNLDKKPEIVPPPKQTT